MGFLKRPVNYTSCVSANGTTHHLLGADTNKSSVNSVSTSITSYQLVSTRIKLVVSSKCQKVTFSSDSSRKMAIWQSSQQQALLGRTALGPVSVHHSLCPVSIPKLIEAIICTISRNQRRSQRISVWRKQDFSASLTGSDQLFADSAYGMGKEGQKRLGPLAFLGPSLRLNGAGPGLIRSLHDSNLNQTWSRVIRRDWLLHTRSRTHAFFHSHVRAYAVTHTRPPAPPARPPANARTRHIRAHAHPHAHPARTRAQARARITRTSVQSTRAHALPVKGWAGSPAAVSCFEKASWASFLCVRTGCFDK